MEYYTIQDSDSRQYTIAAFGHTWAVDRHTVDRGKLYPVAVSPAFVGKRVYRFTDSLRRECLQVEGVEGGAGRFTMTFENVGA